MRSSLTLTGVAAIALFTFGFTGQAGRKPAKRTTQTAVCASNLGTGVKTNRQFCDVIIASSAAESVSMTIPARTGAATLMFDLHNRFPVPAASIDPIQAFTSHVAVVAVIKSTGELIERTAVSREYRTMADLFDRIGGPARGSAPKNIAPGQPQPVRVTIPAGITGIGIVGTRIEEWRASGRVTYDNPRPIAIVSNWRIEVHPSLMADLIDVVIIGGGPAGLAAAIAAHRRGMTYQVLEKAALVNSLLHYPDEMVFFTTPELMEIGGLPFVSPNEKPSRREALRYYRRVTDSIALNVALFEPVTNLRRRPDGFFDVVSQPRNGAPVERVARFVVLASGAYDIANRIGVPGEDLPHVSHYYRDTHSHYRRQVVIVGGKNSAAEAALEIYRAGGHPTIVHRGAALGDSIKYWVKPDIDNRIKERSVGAMFNTTVVEITPAHVVVNGPAGRSEVPADTVLLMTGYRSDPVLLREAGAALDPETAAPVHDEQSFETTVPGLFVIGAFVAGKQSGRIFIENGRFHGEVVIAEIGARLGPKRS